MIGKITRGERIGGLFRYLFGPTRFETSPHADPHLVAAWDGIDGIEPPAADNAVGFDVRQLKALLEAPLAYAERVPAKPVWHCSVRAAPTDRLLSDAEWADIARDVVSSVGLGAKGNRSGVRWAAVRHAPDHIHVVATLVREDGTPARLDFDKKALRSACIRIEERYGLRVTAPADGTAVLGPSRAEIEKARRSGRDESLRETLRRYVRTAAAGAFTETDFWRRLNAEGVLVRHRMSERNPGEITGYSVALATGAADQLAAARTVDGDPLFFSGGKLAPELSLPRLRSRWVGEKIPLGELELREGDRGVLWRSVIDGVADAERYVRGQTAVGTYERAGDVAEASLDLLLSTANVLERCGDAPLHRVCGYYERAAREPRGRLDARTPRGDRLRMAAVMVGVLAGAGAGEDRYVAALIRGLERLTDALSRLRSGENRVSQAEATEKARAALLAISLRPPDERPAPAHSVAGQQLRSRQRGEQRVARAR